MKLKRKMKPCIICHTEIMKDPSLYELINNQVICYRCLSKLKFAKKMYRISVLYEYNEFFRDLLYRYKGQGERDLGIVFLHEHKRNIEHRYKGYVIVPVPSYYVEDEIRGYNHVVEMFRFINLPIKELLYKNKQYKQATSKDRNLIKTVISIKEQHHLEGVKVLLVDDVLTTGKTIEHCKNLLIKCGVKDIKVLVISKK